MCGCFGQDGQETGNGTLLLKGQSSVNFPLQPLLQELSLGLEGLRRGQGRTFWHGVVEAVEWVMSMAVFSELAVLSRGFQSSASHGPLSLQTRLPHPKSQVGVLPMQQQHLLPVELLCLRISSAFIWLPLHLLRDWEPIWQLFLAPRGRTPGARFFCETLLFKSMSGIWLKKYFRQFLRLCLFYVQQYLFFP